MEQKLTILTIGVNDLSAMRNFYVQKFGWAPAAENKDIVFFVIYSLHNFRHNNSL